MNDNLKKAIELIEAKYPDVSIEYITVVHMTGENSFIFRSYIGKTGTVDIFKKQVIFIYEA